IDSASSGDTVLVYSGTYNENLTIDSKGIALISEYGSDSTIIDGGGNGTVLTINNVFDRIDSSSVINGFTLKNGSADNLTNGELSGGGIHFRSGSLVFNDLVVENNYADGFGGGVCVINVEKAIFNNCIVRSNYSGVGCGLHLIGTQLELNNVLVVGNEGTGRGTSVLLSGYGNDKTHVLNHVTITGNLNTGEAIYTSGLYLGGGNVTILNSIIEGNEHGSIGINENTHNEKITIANSVIKRGSTDGTYGGIGDIQINEIGDNNYILDTSNVYDYDPLFHDPENADYTLSDFSPIIGKGLEFLDVSWGSKPFTKTILPLPVDLMGNKRPNPTGSYPDIGAYESVYSSRSPKANTISDGLSDTLEMDFSNATNTLSAHWKTFDDDGTITYEYAIGTNTLNNVVDWTSNGTDTSVTVTGLTLVNGETYFFSVRGTDNNGQVSDTASTDGVFIDNEIPVINTIYESPGVFINQSIQFGPDSSNIGLAHLIDNNLSSETSGAMTVEFWIKHDQGSIAYNLNPFYGKFFRVMFVQMQGIDYAGVIVGKFQFHWINENGNDD
ncbi:MAG: hypothetical protein ACE5D7_11225, partial [Fidelibacterota bacterium]